MNISNVQMSIFYSNNSFDYNNKELIKLIDIFEGIEILPSFFVEINNKNKSNRPFIKNIDNGSIIMFGSSRMDVKLDDIEPNTNRIIEYSDDFFTDFFQNNIPYLKKIKNTFDLNVNRLAINLYLSSQNNKVVNILKKIDFYSNSNKYNIRMDKKHKFNKLNHDINVISNLISDESGSIICTLDINTVINNTSKFDDADIDIFFKEGFSLSNIIINELIVN